MSIDRDLEAIIYGRSEGATERLMEWLVRNGKHLNATHASGLQQAIIAVVDESYRAGQKTERQRVVEQVTKLNAFDGADAAEGLRDGVLRILDARS